MKLKNFLKLLDNGEDVEICYYNDTNSNSRFELVNFGLVCNLKRTYAYDYFLKNRDVLKVLVNGESECMLIVVSR